MVRAAVPEALKKAIIRAAMSFSPGQVASPVPVAQLIGALLDTAAGSARTADARLGLQAGRLQFFPDV